MHYLCDLKMCDTCEHVLDNVMLISDEDDSSVKLIDFGFMVSIDYPNETMRGTGVMGTEGYYAPETLTQVRMEYN